MERIDSAEFTQWQAMEIVDPWWLPERIDNAIGALSALIYNMRQRRVRQRPVRDFVIDYVERARRALARVDPKLRPSTADLVSRFKRATIALGGKVVKRG